MLLSFSERFIKLFWLGIREKDKMKKRRKTRRRRWRKYGGEKAQVKAFWFSLENSSVHVPVYTRNASRQD